MVFLERNAKKPGYPSHGRDKARPPVTKVRVSSWTPALFLLTMLVSPSSLGYQPVWAKRGVNFPARCFSDSRRECRAVRIPSPNRQNFVSVRYSKVAASDGGSFLSVSLRVNRKNGTSFEIQPRGLVEGELLWSPDSSSFLVNSSDGGEGPQFVQIYQVNEAEIDPGESSVIAAAQQDMLEHFPPCRAKDADPEDCAWLASHGEAVNVAAVDWTRGSSAIVVMAEMPCSSRFGS